MSYENLVVRDAVRLAFALVMAFILVVGLFVGVSGIIYELSKPTKQECLK